jgi:hypothetical protein
MIADKDFKTKRGFRHQRGPERVATKDDLKSLATKEELKSVATERIWTI